MHVKEAVLSAYSFIVEPRPCASFDWMPDNQVLQTRRTAVARKGQCDNDANTATMLMDTTIRRLNQAKREDQGGDIS